MACLIGHLVDVIAAFQCVGTEEVPQRVRGNGIGVCIKDPIDLPPGQVFTVPPGEEVRAIGVRPFLQVLPNCINNLISDEHHSHLVTLAPPHCDLLGF